ncbi:hypothetical protein J7E86_08465 [Streptomyces sp. ISL-11]|nr:hypothetical protein [Streptomyces sp. ISL-11]
MSAWRTGGAPHVAIVDWERSFRWEFEALQAELRGQGVSAVVCTPDDLHYDIGRGLYTCDAGGRRCPVTVVLRRVVLNDLLSRYGHALTEHPMTLAWAAGACVMVNPFTSHLAHKKSVLAPFLFGVDSPGCISRLSLTSLVNVSAGGSVVPVFRVEPRARREPGLRERPPGRGAADPGIHGAILGCQLAHLAAGAVVGGGQSHLDHGCLLEPAKTESDHPWKRGRRGRLQPHADFCAAYSAPAPCGTARAGTFVNLDTVERVSPVQGEFTAKAVLARRPVMAVESGRPDRALMSDASL